MTKRAHITSRPAYQVGDSVLGLCGKEFTVKVLWDDLPDDKPICRRCVDAALLALTEADQVITLARIFTDIMVGQAHRLDDVLRPSEQMYLDNFVEDDRTYQEAQQTQEQEKQAEIKVQQTCICTWETPENFVVNPNCPIHGAPIAPPSEGEDA